MEADDPHRFQGEGGTSMRHCAQLARLVMAVGFFAASTGVHLLADDVYIVVNSTVKAESISKEELRSVFLLRTRTLKDGSVVEPVLQKSGSAHDAFLEHYLERDSAEIRTYYQGLVFTGKAEMPRQLNSDGEVIAYVARTKGAIGYVSSESSTSGVKVLKVLSSERKAERSLLTRVEAAYPEALWQRDIHGSVRLRLTIAPKGNVEEVELLGGNPILAEAAEKAVRQWIYSAWPSRTMTEVTIAF